MATAGTLMLRAHYTDLFSERLAYIDEIMFENYDSPSMIYPEVFNVRDSGRAYEEITEISGFGKFTQKPEGQVVDYDQLLQGFNKRFTHITYGKGWQMSFEAMDDDIDGVITNAAPALSRAARNSIEAELVSDLNGAFDVVTVPQGGFLVGGGHNLLYGGQFSNLITGDFSQGTLETALNKFADFVDLRGELLNIEPMKIVIPFELQWLVSEVMNSVQRSDTANNTINVLPQLQVVVWRYLTSATAWFLMSDPSQHRLLCYWRMEPVIDHAIDFDSDNAKTKMKYRLSHGPADYKGIVGSKGGV